jgi:hypothetical protein
VKKRLIIGLFAALGLVFWADNRWSDRDDRDALFLPGLREPGRLKAVLVPDFGVFRIQEGLPTGFDYQLLKWFANDAQLKLEITFAPTRLAALDSVREGRADVACGPMGEKRRRNLRCAIHGLKFVFRTSERTASAGNAVGSCPQMDGLGLEAQKPTRVDGGIVGCRSGRWMGLSGRKCSIGGTDFQLVDQ